jgi:hypothetical protein
LMGELDGIWDSRLDRRPDDHRHLVGRIKAGRRTTKARTAKRVRPATLDERAAIVAATPERYRLMVQLASDDMQRGLLVAVVTLIGGDISGRLADLIEAPTPTLSTAATRIAPKALSPFGRPGRQSPNCTIPRAHPAAGIGFSARLGGGAPPTDNRW